MIWTARASCKAMRDDSRLLSVSLCFLCSDNSNSNRMEFVNKASLFLYLCILFFLIQKSIEGIYESGCRCMYKKKTRSWCSHVAAASYPVCVVMATRVTFTSALWIIWNTWPARDSYSPSLGFAWPLEWERIPKQTNRVKWRSFERRRRRRRLKDGLWCACVHL